MPSPFFLLHLSDLHFGNEFRLQQRDPAGFGRTTARDVLDARAVLGSDAPVGVVVVTGDVAHKALAREYEAAVAFLAALADELEVERRRFVFCPGNHDVSWPACKQVEAKFEDEEIEEDEVRTRMDRTKLARFQKLVGTFWGVSDLAAVARPLSNGALLHTFDDLSLSVAALNSCERESHRDEDHRGELSARQTQALLGAWEEPRAAQMLRVAAVHHNPDATVPADVGDILKKLRKGGHFDDKTLTRYATDLVGFEGRKELCRLARNAQVSLLLHGHFHATAVRHWPWRENGGTHVLAAGSVGLVPGKLPDEEPNALRLVHLDPGAKRLNARALCWDPRAASKGEVESGAWVPGSGELDAYVQPLSLPSGWRAGKADTTTPQNDEAPLPDLRPYLSYLIEVFGHIDMPGLQGSDVRKLPLEQVYVRLRMRRSPAAADEPGKPGRHGELGAAGLEDAVGEAKLAIVGDPGSGKSTVLQYVALHLARAVRNGTPLPSDLAVLEGPPPVPLLLSIPELADDLREAGYFEKRRIRPDAWMEILAKGLERVLTEPRGLRRLFDEGGVLLLLDGLDEVADRAERAKLLDGAAHLAEALPGSNERPNRVVITCRTKAWGDGKRLAAFEEAELQALDRAAIGDLVRRWFRAAKGSSPEAERLRTGLLAAVDRSIAVRQIATNPLMLTMLCILFHAKKRLPEQRALLYQECVDHLIGRHADHLDRWGGTTVAERLLRSLAGAMQEATHPDGERRDAVDRYDAEQLVKQEAPLKTDEEAARLLDELELHVGLLRARGRAVTFHHRTFQEFLVAREAAASPDPLEALGTRLLEPGWREVVALTAGVLAMHGGERRVHDFLKGLVGAPDAPVEERPRCGPRGLLPRRPGGVEAALVHPRPRAGRRRAGGRGPRGPGAEGVAEDPHRGGRGLRPRGRPADDGGETLGPRAGGALLAGHRGGRRQRRAPGGLGARRGLPDPAVAGDGRGVRALRRRGRLRWARLVVPGGVGVAGRRAAC